MAGALMTRPLYRHGRKLGESDAIALYSAATGLDNVPGAYPPEDTGSSGLAVAKAAKAAGYITRYEHAFGLDHALGALMLGPVLIGSNFYDSMMKPLPSGEIRITPNADVLGGHEYQAFGVNVRDRRVWCWNSWGPTWAKSGRFWISWDTLDRLLSEDGDVTVPIMEKVAA